MAKKPKMILFDWGGTIERHGSQPRDSAYSDAKSTLPELMKDQINLGIVSRLSTSFLMYGAHINGLHRYICAYCGGTNCDKSERIIALCWAFNVKPDEVVFVGDEDGDVMSAKAAGVISVALCKGDAHRAKMTELEPDYLIDSLTDLLRIFGATRDKNVSGVISEDAK
jgi:phosphoglycolate phosphatase-like HAD superfamily hydrolase